MNIRKLCGALTLLLFVTPLGAALCGDCASGACMVLGMSQTPAPSESRVQGSQAEGPCHEAEETKDEPAPCHDAPIVPLTPSDCCITASASETEHAAVHPAPLVSEISLAAADDPEPSAATYDRSGSERQPPPCEAPRPLYTLHNAYLI